MSELTNGVPDTALSNSQKRELLKSLVQHEMKGRGCSYDEAFNTVATLRPLLTNAGPDEGKSATTPPLDNNASSTGALSGPPHKTAAFARGQYGKGRQ
jgi:hypothetical protein